ncbi:Rne/Rng family ribonuclease [Geoalkalibacter sp.]|uniref:Rne/Rng family ribonuclease n=1 Tax=Geoalkalibacter sp. TaxID=3041440 RepID=UPI00272ECB94|nr:Rne/Rng family ribonuclease [Geoalkalibacter sp.]
MSRKMLINATHPEEHRVAIVEDGFLTELDIEITGKEQTRGNVYKALVVRVESGLQAAFVDYGAERLGFLQMGEIHPALFPKSDINGRSRARINEILRPGQEILVQVLKEERGTKGAALTTFLSLPGRYMVLMPESPTKGVSRKIEEEAERKKLKKAMAELDLPEDMGYIVRTAGIGKTPEELRRDFDNLVKIYRGIEERSRQLKAPSLVFRESNLIIRCIRDYFTEDTEEVLVDDPAVFEEAREFFRMLMPDKLRLVKLHQERRPIFSRYQIEEQIETMAHNKVLLPSGGSIVLDATEALVAIDVNSGKMAGEQGIEATASKTNLEAAVEIARQLRLRDLAGLIVIDFIDMRDRKHIKAVEKTLRDALQKDKARVTVGRISQFGLLEMSRQRLKPMLAAASYLECPHCQGRGRIKSAEAQGVAFLRRIQTAVAKGQILQAEGFVPLDVADFLLNHKREELVAMEQKYDMKIILHGRAGLLPHQSNLNLVRREKEEETREKPEFLPPEPGTPLEPPALAEPTPVVEEIREEAAAGPQETDPEEKPGKKKRRRRRRKKSLSGETLETGAEEEVSGEGEEPEAAEASVAEPVPPATTTPAEHKDEAAAPAGKTKKKSRSRRRKKTEAINVSVAPASASPTATTTEPQPVPPAELPQDDAEKPAEEKKSPARARRGRVKKTAESAEETPEAPSNTKPDAKSPKAKAPRKPKASTDSATPETQTEPGETKTKPRPRRASSRKKAPADPDRGGAGQEATEPNSES